ncbi:MAG: DUF2905 domain-containing protein [Desulfomonilaceae bacterium]
MDHDSLGKLVIILGLSITGIGLLIWIVGKWGLPFGSLPGDISVDRPGFSFRFPIATSIILSLALTILLNAIFWFFRK